MTMTMPQQTEKRLKVSDFYKQKQILCVQEIQYLHKAFFQLQNFYYITKNAPVILHQYSLKQKIINRIIQLPFQTIKILKIFHSIICIVFQQDENLWVYNSKQQFIKLHSHYIPITCLGIYLGNVITGSKDMTIRVWKWDSNNSSLVQDKKLHIWSGHCGQITCFLNISKLLLSGSKDKTLIVWKGPEISTKKTFQSHILQLIQCQQSSQFIVYQSNETISILNTNSLLKQHKLIINRNINGVIGLNIRCLNQMDDSFIQIVGRNMVEIAEINLGQVMGKIKYDFNNCDIMTAKCLRRMTLLAIEGKGLFIIHF